MKRLVLLPLLFVAAGCDSGDKAYNGYVEGEYVYIAPTTAGLLESLFVVRGQQVEEGADLFALDRTALAATLATAEAEAVQAEAIFTNASREYVRAQKLLPAEAISKSDFDARLAAYETSKAGLQVAAQKVTQTKKQLADSAPKAPVAGRVEDTYFLVGEYVAAGAPVVSLLPPGNVKVRFFVPQAELSRFELGRKVSIRCDGCGKAVAGKISYIASQSEYTPPVIYSVGSRDKLVFRVEAMPDAFSPALRPGLPVDVVREAR
ncbi:MAG: efflux RND transporter periplasmic adaptor subunit [Alphaproteobacteria bacterium]|nr:efflux RND transporter periplasmic adaptor subunit [Alphaproteobacteria bacterium]